MDRSLSELYVVNDLWSPGFAQDIVILLRLTVLTHCEHMLISLISHPFGSQRRPTRRQGWCFGNQRPKIPASFILAGFRLLSTATTEAIAMCSLGVGIHLVVNSLQSYVLGH